MAAISDSLTTNFDVWTAAADFCCWEVLLKETLPKVAGANMLGGGGGGGGGGEEEGLQRFDNGLTGGESEQQLSSSDP